MLLQAHKGVSTEYPENTMPAFEAAVEQGYGLIELDVSVTKDLQCVLLHDETINRVARNEDGSRIEPDIAISQITYAEALQYDFGIGFHKKFRGTRIAHLKDVLELVRDTPVKLKLDNKFHRFTPPQMDAFLTLLKPYEKNIAFTCFSAETVGPLIAAFPGSQIHYDGPVSEDTLLTLSKLVPREQLVVWLPMANRLTTWVRVGFATRELAQLVHRYAQLGIWILCDNEQLDIARQEFCADYVETNGQLKPVRNPGVIADMHNHSKISHDAQSDLYELCQKELDSGVTVVAVTDHCDTFAYDHVDLVGNARATRAYVDEVQEAFRGNVQLLNGIEYGEGFWFPDVARKVAGACSYDVIIGSVHAVQYEPFSSPFASRDFTNFTQQQVHEFVDAYFDDMYTMLEVMDFDILAHLTNPLRYIVGTYGFQVDLSRYMEKIRRILQYTIDHGIALEINTSSLHTPYGKPMPDFDIMQMYYDMGGYLITIGSDSHVVQNAAYAFEDTITRLKAIGFQNIFYFKDRKPVQCTLL